MRVGPRAGSSGGDLDAELRLAAGPPLPGLAAMRDAATHDPLATNTAHTEASSEVAAMPTNQDHPPI